MEKRREKNERIRQSAAKHGKTRTRRKRGTRDRERDRGGKKLDEKHRETFVEK